MWPITKSRKDNNLIDLIGVILAKQDIELSRPIEQCVFYDENEIEQQCGRSYRSAL